MICLQKLSKIIGLIAFLLFPTYGIASAEQPDEAVKANVQLENEEAEEGTVKDYLERTKEDVQEEPLRESEEPEEMELKTSSAADFSFGDIFRMIASLLFVGAILYFLLQFLKKKNQAFQRGHIISNLGGTSVGSNKSIQIVKVGSKLYIVGVGENVQLLSEITDPEEIKSMLQDHNEAIESMLKPSDILTKMKNMRVNRDNEVTFIEQFKKQLNDMSMTRKQLKNELQKTEDKEDE